VVPFELASTLYLKRKIATVLPLRFTYSYLYYLPQLFFIKSILIFLNSGLDNAP